MFITTDVREAVQILRTEIHKLEHLIELMEECCESADQHPLGMDHIIKEYQKIIRKFEGEIARMQSEIDSLKNWPN